MAQPIEFTIDDGIGRVALNRPEVRNAISRDMWDGLPEAMDAARADGARVIIIEGRGQYFASGADLNELKQLADLESARDHWFSIYDSLNRIAAFELPTIAAIHGPCIGGGCLLAIACDLRYCEPGSRFGIPVAQLGIVLDDDNIERLVNLVGTAVAKELLFTAATINAERAQSIGLVNGVFAPEVLQSSVLKTAKQIKDNSEQTVLGAKRVISRLGGGEGWGKDRQQTAVVGSYVSADFKKRSSAE